MPKRFYSISMAALALTGLMALFSATPSVAEEKPRIAFAKGANSAVCKGEIQGMDRDIYPITAKAGQTMHEKRVDSFRKPAKGRQL